MSNDQPLDRPATLKRTAKPAPAPDESIDPVDTAPNLKPAKPAAQRPTKRRELTFPFSTRVSQAVLDVLDAATLSGAAPSQRAAVEEAVLNYWGPKVNP